ncbi:unnamed protein product [Paramecium pentaurelia]|uniref:Transmembrane protein n=1 Tax=Paramecium pentaurelia TaxID=43138 RepID=A0A8S1W3M4_9CILI|nr:unnamed protein product [Paramecium pentaurelia]
MNNYLLDQNNQQKYLNPQTFETLDGRVQKMNQFEFQDYQKDSQIRVDFFKKMYSFLTFEFLFNFGMIALGFDTDLKELLIHTYYQCYEQQNYIICDYHNSPAWLFYVSLIISIILQFTLYFGGTIVRKTPVNYIIFILYLVFYGFTLSAISIFMAISQGKLAVWITWTVDLLIILTFTIYGYFKRERFLSQVNIIPYFIVSAIIIFCIAIPFVFFLIMYNFHYAWMGFFYGLVSIMYGFYLMLETRSIMRKGGLILQIDDYLAGSLLLYGLMVQPLVRIFELLKETCGNRSQ